MYNSQTKILVTGGAGFVGTNFINDLLNRGHNPKCIAVIDNMEHGTYIPKVHDQIENFHKVDIRNQYVENIIQEFSPNYVYHFVGLYSYKSCLALLLITTSKSKYSTASYCSAYCSN